MFFYLSEYKFIFYYTPLIRISTADFIVEVAGAASAGEAQRTL
jgi:hypothetical protein